MRLADRDEHVVAGRPVQVRLVHTADHARVVGLAIDLVPTLAGQAVRGDVQVRHAHRGDRPRELCHARGGGERVVERSPLQVGLVGGARPGIGRDLLEVQGESEEAAAGLDDVRAGLAAGKRPCRCRWSRSGPPRRCRRPSSSRRRSRSPRPRPTGTPQTRCRRSPAASRYRRWRPPSCRRKSRSRWSRRGRRGRRSRRRWRRRKSGRSSSPSCCRRCRSRCQPSSRSVAKTRR